MFPAPSLSGKRRIVLGCGGLGGFLGDTWDLRAWACACNVGVFGLVVLRNCLDSLATLL